MHSRKPWLLLLCIVYLVGRISGAHWHLCYDGNAPSHAVHVWDGAMDDKSEPGHNDTSLNLMGDGPFKTIDNAVDLPVLFGVFGLLGLLLLPPRRPTRIEYQTPFLPPTPSSFTAQPRAPPR